jgi:hypothetical protein
MRTASSQIPRVWSNVKGAWLVGDNNNNQQAQVGWTRGLGRGRQTPERVQRENLTTKQASERDENEKPALVDAAGGLASYLCRLGVMWALRALCA